jgi:two-component system NtrC family sensor kinase
LKKSSTRPSVLIADNNRFYRTAIGDLYREMDYDVRVAQDGIQALEQINAARPDLLVLDLIMPRIDGAQLCALVKGRKDLRSMRVIILSGILADEIDDVGSIGADAYIAKMPLEQIAPELREVSRALMSGEPGPSPRIHGFDRMYRREVVLELLRERRTRREILDSLSEGIVELSEDGRLLAANRAFQIMCGRTEADMLSLRLDEILPASRVAFEALYAEVRSGAAVGCATLEHEGRILQVKLHRLQHENREADDAVRQAMRAAAAGVPSRVPEGEPGVGYTLLVEDCTQQARADRERERLGVRLAQSERMSAIGVLVSGFAHELNNPLTSVLGYAQLLQHRHADPGLSCDLGKIAAGANRCKEIVENLLVFARSVRPAKALVDPNEILLEAAASARGRMQEIRAELDVDLAPDVPRVLADPGQLTQAIEHILDNAVKALSDWHGERRISLRSMVEGERVRLEIADSGAGIPAAVMGRIFQPFFSTRPVGQGAGLGLSAAYGIVTAHGGRISAGAAPGGGAVLRLDLPRAPEGTAAAAVNPRGVERAPGASGRSILIVDDEAVVAELLADLFEEGGHHIDTAGNGREGLRKLRSGAYDLIVLDLRLPDMPGQQLYEELRRDLPALLPRILFITADTLTPEVRAFLDDTARPWLQKPFSIESLMDRAGAILAAGA